MTELLTDEQVIQRIEYSEGPFEMFECGFNPMSDMQTEGPLFKRLYQLHKTWKSAQIEEEFFYGFLDKFKEKKDKGEI